MQWLFYLLLAYEWLRCLLLKFCIIFFNYQRFYNVTIDNDLNTKNKYVKQLNIFYLCNNIHNINTLFDFLGVENLNSICFLYKDNIIQMNFEDKNIVINMDNRFNIFLGDISINMLDQILETPYIS